MEYVGLALIGAGILLGYSAYKNVPPWKAVTGVLSTGKVGTTSTAPAPGVTTL